MRGIPASDALERRIGEEAGKLEQVCDRIRSCQVLAEARRREPQQEEQFAVRLIVTLPGTEVVVNREHGADVYIALRDAFAAVGVLIEEHMRHRAAEPASGRGTLDTRS